MPACVRYMARLVRCVSLLNNDVWIAAVDKNSKLAWRLLASEEVADDDDDEQRHADLVVSKFETAVVEPSSVASLSLTVRNNGRSRLRRA